LDELDSSLRQHQEEQEEEEDIFSCPLVFEAQLVQDPLSECKFDAVRDLSATVRHLKTSFLDSDIPAAVCSRLANCVSLACQIVLEVGLPLLRLQASDYTPLNDTSDELERFRARFDEIVSARTV